MFTYALIFLTSFIPANFVSCGSQKPFWHCIHVFKKTVEYVYAICSSCTLKLENQPATTKRRKHNESNGTSIKKIVMTHIPKIIKYGI